MERYESIQLVTEPVMHRQLSRVVNGVKRRAQVEHDKTSDKAVIDRMDDIVMNTQHSCLCRMVVTVDRPSRREKLVGVNMCDKTATYNPL